MIVPMMLDSFRMLNALIISENYNVATVNTASSLKELSAFTVLV
jgi:hypothetical protein